jgi:hypothetical protein
VTALAFESFEFRYLKATHAKKLGARHLTFKGLPSYQIDAALPDGKGVAVLLLYANKQLYVLQAFSVEAPVDPKDAAPIFQGFNFTGMPEPVVEAEYPVLERGRSIGHGRFELMLVVGVLVALYYLA